MHHKTRQNPTIDEKKSYHLLRSYKFTIFIGIVNVAIVAVLLMYMTKTNNQSENVAQDTQSIATLNIKNQVLQEQIAQAQSVVNVNNKAQELGMVPVNTIIYLTNTNVIADNMQ